MSTEQLAFKIADEAFASTEYKPHVPLWKRTPNDEEIEFEYRPSEAPNERDEHYWYCTRTYSVTKADMNYGFTLTELKHIKRLMIEQLSAESGGLTTEQRWKYEMRWKVWRACHELWLKVWLE